MSWIIAGLIEVAIGAFVVGDHDLCFSSRQIQPLKFRVRVPRLRLEHVRDHRQSHDPGRFDLIRLHKRHGASVEAPCSSL